MSARMEAFVMFALGSALCVGFYALAATVLGGTSEGEIVKVVAGAMLGWLGLNKPALLPGSKARASLPPPG